MLRNLAQAGVTGFLFVFGMSTVLLMMALERAAPHPDGSAGVTP